MPRTYVRKTQRGSYGSDTLRAALEEIANGASLNHTSNKYGINRKALRRHRDSKVAKPGTIALGRFKPEFSTEFEEALCAKIKQMESMLFGLTVLDIRRLAFDLAEYLGLNHRFNKSSKLAGKDWLSGFLRRNESVAIRRPEAVSLSRAVGFNRPQVEKFFSCYKSLLQSSNFSASKIWNMDETGVSCVQRPTKVLAAKGKKCVGKITSAERGKNVTAICAFNAAGNYIPPMLIFPRKRLPPAMMHGAPPESLGSCSDNGWSDGDQFMKWLEHFVLHARPSKENAHIILLDGHHSHKTLQAVEFASDHGIHMLTLPPHCTHRMQPCDRTFFKPLKAAYNAAADAWMVSHPAQRITFYEVAGIFGQAYTRAATVGVAVNGFESCGLWPYNDNIFTEADFAPSQVTDEPDPSDTTDAVRAHAVVETAPVPPPMQTTVAPQTGSHSPHQTSTAPQPSTSAPRPTPSTSVPLPNGTSPAPQPTPPSFLQTPTTRAPSQIPTVASCPTPTTTLPTPEVLHAAHSTTMGPAPPSTTPVSDTPRTLTIFPTHRTVTASATPTHRTLPVPSPIPTTSGPPPFRAEPVAASTMDALTHPPKVSSTAAAPPSVQHSGSSTSSAPNSNQSMKTILEKLFASPKASKSRRRSRKAESSQLLTASPYKRRLMDAIAKKKHPKASSTKGKGKGKGKGKKKESSSDEDEYPCLVCGEDFASSRPGEQWIACAACGRWSHEECTPCMGVYICQNCESDD